MNELDKLQPNNVEAEEAVLGSLLIDPDAILRVSAFLDPADFFVERNGWIYEAIYDLHERNDPADMVTLTDELTRRGQLAELGGSAYLSSLINATPTSIHVEYYAHIIERTAVLRRLIAAAGEIARLAYQDTEDVSEVVDRAESIIYEVGAKRQRGSSLIHIGEVGRKAHKLLHETLMNPTGFVLPTGIPQLDDIFNGGLDRGTVTVISGEQGRGKTALALAIARHNSIEGDKAGAVFSLEMEDVKLVQRWTASLTGINQSKIKRAKLGNEEWAQVTAQYQAFAQNSLWICEEGGLTVEKLLLEARRGIRKYGLRYIVCDYLQLLEVEANIRNIREATTYTTKKIKNFARENGIHFILLAQPKREVDKVKKIGRRLTIADLRESSSIESDADNIVFIQPSSAFTDDPDITAALLQMEEGGPIRLVVLDVPKARGDEANKYFPILFNGATQTFVPLVRKTHKLED